MTTKTKQRVAEREDTAMIRVRPQFRKYLKMRAAKMGIPSYIAVEALVAAAELEEMSFFDSAYTTKLNMRERVLEALRGECPKNIEGKLLQLWKLLLGEPSAYSKIK